MLLRRRRPDPGEDEEEQDELVPGPIYGLRVWGVDPLTADLRAPVWGGRWEEDGEFTEAQCSVSHDPPQPDCGCGLYGLHPAVKGVDRLLRAQSGAEADYVIGIVEAVGAVEVHADGFRAERARPHSLAVIAGDSLRRSLAERAAERYGAELLEFDCIEDLAVFCRSLDLGLSEATIERLVGKARGHAAPEPGRLRRVLDQARLGLLMLLIGAFHPIGIIVLLFIAGTLFGSDPDPQEPPPVGAGDPRLELVDESLRIEDGRVHYLALVENRSRNRSALGVRARGHLLDEGGATVAWLSGPGGFDRSVSLGPGQRGLIVDKVPRRDAPSGWARSIEGRETVAVARRWTKGPVVEPPRVDPELVIDRRSCLLSARVRSERRISRAEIGLYADDPERADGEADLGEAAGFWWRDVGPIRPGRSRMALAALDPGQCARPKFRGELSITLPAKLLAQLPS